MYANYYYMMQAHKHVNTRYTQLPRMIPIALCRATNRTFRCWWAGTVPAGDWPGIRPGWRTRTPWAASSSGSRGVGAAGSRAPQKGCAGTGGLSPGYPKFSSTTQWKTWSDTFLCSSQTVYIFRRRKKLSFF